MNGQKDRRSLDPPAEAENRQKPMRGSEGTKRRLSRQESSGPAIISVLLMCSSLEVKAQLVDPLAGGFSSLQQQLAALSHINPQELAAQTAQNARLAQRASQAPAAAPTSGPAVVSPAIIDSLRRSAAQIALAKQFSLPPAPDLSGAVGEPTSAAGFELQSPTSAFYASLAKSRQGSRTSDTLAPVQDVLQEAQGPAPVYKRHILEAMEPSMMAPRPTNDLQEQFQSLYKSMVDAPSLGPKAAGPMGISQPAAAPRANGGPTLTLPPSAITTSPGVYGIPGPEGMLKAYRNPTNVPPTQSLNT